jgi:hypothetical protein
MPFCCVSVFRIESYRSAALLARAPQRLDRRPHPPAGHRNGDSQSFGRPPHPLGASGNGDSHNFRQSWARATFVPGVPARWRGDGSIVSGAGSPGSGGETRFGLDFDEHVRIDQVAHLDHGGRGPNGAEDLSMRPANGFPVADDVRDVNAGAHNVFQ